jgi:hypothetical protein
LSSIFTGKLHLEDVVARLDLLKQPRRQFHMHRGLVELARHDVVEVQVFRGFRPFGGQRAFLHALNGNSSSRVALVGHFQPARDLRVDVAQFSIAKRCVMRSFLASPPVSINRLVVILVVPSATRNRSA